MAFRKPQKLASDALWEYALRVLGSRAHSAAELRRKLARRAQSSIDVTAAMSRLSEYGMLDDGRFSEAFASARLANQGLGRERVLRELRSRQVAAGIAEQAVGEVFRDTDERQLAEAFLLRKYRGRDLRQFLAEEKNLASAYRRLRTAGFSSATVWSVLKTYNRQVESCDEPEEDPG